MRPEHEQSYRADVDGLRAVAVLAVVCFHAFPELLPGGFVGVDVFFVISGFLITRLLRAESARGRISLLAFYLRRIRRIFPALTVVLIACAVAGWYLLFLSELQQLGGHIVASALSFANLVYLREAGYFDVSGDAKPLLHLWSLGVEEQFYLFWPLLMAWAGASQARARNAVLVVIGASFVLNVVLVREHAVWAFYLPFTRLWELALGGWLAIAAPSARSELAPWFTRSAAAPAGVVLLLAALALVGSDAAFPGWWALLPTLATAALIAAGPDAWINRRILSAAPVVHLGLISYPLYLWHWPLLSFGRIASPRVLSVPATLALIAAALLLAELTYRLFELPIRRRGSATRWAAPLLAGVALVAAVGWHYEIGWVLPRLPGLVREVEAERTRDRKLRDSYPSVPCESVREIAPLLHQSCRYLAGPPDAPTIALWGDSHAGSWAPAIYELAQQRGYNAVIVFVGGCPPLLGVRQSSSAAALPCRDPRLGQLALDTLAAFEPVHIVLTARWGVYADGLRWRGHLEPDTRYLTVHRTGSADRASSRAALASQLPITVRALRKLAPVTIVKAVPTLEVAVDAVRVQGRAPFEPTLDEHRRDQAFSERVIDALANPAAGVTVLDPALRLCTPRCWALRDGQLMLIDDNHLSAQTALRFVPDLLALLPAATRAPAR